jgi:hypothetical protein
MMWPPRVGHVGLHTPTNTGHSRSHTSLECRFVMRSSRRSVIFGCGKDSLMLMIMYKVWAGETRVLVYLRCKLGCHATGHGFWHPRCLTWQGLECTAHQIEEWAVTYLIACHGRGHGAWHPCAPLPCRKVMFRPSPWGYPSELDSGMMPVIVTQVSRGFEGWHAAAAMS